MSLFHAPVSLQGQTGCQQVMSIFLLLAAPASEMPAPRALHTLTSLGQYFVLLGGKGPLGELRDVSLLECPAVQHGLQLQHQQQASQAQLLRCQQRGAQVAADLACSRAQLQEAMRQLQVIVWQDLCMYASASARPLQDENACLNVPAFAR
jgi:hypothetical protein